MQVKINFFVEKYVKFNHVMLLHLSKSHSACYASRFEHVHHSKEKIP